jgi:KpsF/GutQ family protein
MKKENFTKIAKEVIEKEIFSLKKLKLNLNKSFNKAVEAILKCKNGKIILSGVGKSGLIAKKSAATFASTGTPSFFLDASNANHGDMGQISSNDILILISLSGESNELKNIIQFASRNKKIILIGVTSNKNSILYQNSDIKLHLPKVTEADPANIIPTSSTIVQLSIFDALAIACMKAKKFGKLDFKKFHPSGSLSIKLKTVEDLMISGKKLPIINENRIMKDALKIINLKKLGVLIVINKKNITVGIVTDGDIKRATQKNKNIHHLKVKKIRQENLFQ